jgi:transcriptional antiterminator RfaH
LLCDDRLDRGARADNGVWWLAHTRPRQEKAAANALRSRSVGYYLPLVTRKSLLRGRTRTARIPLFPGYLFVFGDDENRLEALKTNRLLTIDKVPDGESLRRQLVTFAELIAAGAPLVREARLVAGEQVRIRSGLFQGVEGVILRRNGKTELLIGIDYLGQGASIEVEDCNTEPV